MKPSPAQLKALLTVETFASPQKPYMPYANEARSYDACRDRGWLVYRRREDGAPLNGFELTEVGREHIKMAERVP